MATQTITKEWGEIPFSECLQKVKVGREKQVKEKDYAQSGKYPIVDQGQSFIAGYTNDERKVISDIQPFIIFGDHTRALKYVDFPVVLGADGTKVIKPNTEFDTKFFYYSLKHIDVPSRGYNRHYTLLKEKNIAHPSLLEQKAIAEALTTVQNAITEQEKLIAKLKELKRSMIQHLFTHGTKGEKTKMTEIGEMPDSWEIVELGDVCEISTGTTPATQNKEYYVGVNPFIKTTDILNNRIVVGNTFVSDDAVKKYNLKKYPVGTLLLAMYGQGKTRGQISILGIEASTSQNAAAIVPSKRILPTFLWQYLLGQYERLRTSGAHGHISHLNLGYMKKFKAPLPSHVEQEKIANTLASISDRIESTQSKLAIYQNLFKTLLHELMSGDRRII